MSDKKKSKKKQPELEGMTGPGVAPVVIPEIDKAAEKYVNIRDKRMLLTEDEIEAKGLLTELMKKHSLKTYRYDERLVELKPGEETVKVKKVKDDVVNVGESD